MEELVQKYLLFCAWSNKISVSILKNILVIGIFLSMFAMPVALFYIAIDTLKEFDDEVEID